jgi:tetratricopeptide (TPR) repeat protein
MNKKYQEILTHLTELEKRGKLSNFTLEEKSIYYYYESSALAQLGQHEEAYTVATEMLQEVELSKDQKIAVKLIAAQLRAMYKMKVLEEAYNVILKGDKIIDSLTLDERKTESPWIAKFHDLSAYIYDIEGDNEKIIQQYEAKLSLGELTNNSLFVVDSLTNLGEVKFFQGELDLALDYFQKSLSLSETSGEDKFLAGSLLGMGLIQSAKGNLDEALEYLQRSLNVNQSLNDFHDVGLLFSQIGSIYRAKGQLELALSYLEKSLENFDSEEVCLCQSDAMLTKIMILLDLKDLRQAQKTLNDLNLAKESNPTRYNALQSQLANALVLKETPRMKEKALAQDLLKSIVEEEVLYFRYTAIAAMHLCELLIIEFRSFGDPGVLEEVKKLIQQINQIGTQGTSYTLIIESSILQAKLLIVEGKLDNALQILEKAQNLTIENRLGLLGQIVNEEKASLEKEYSKWQNLIETNVSMKELVHQVQIEDYLRMAQKMVNVGSPEE